MTEWIICGKHEMVEAAVCEVHIYAHCPECDPNGCEG